jgi:hypothetical protein
MISAVKMKNGMARRGMLRTFSELWGTSTLKFSQFVMVQHEMGFSDIKISHY